MVFDASPILIIFETQGKKKEWNLTQAAVDEWQLIFPTMDVLAECKKAYGWTAANRRKTHDGMKRFLYSWLCKAQNGPPQHNARSNVLPMKKPIEDGFQNMTKEQIAAWGGF